MKKRNQKYGFTLIEIMVAIAILGTSMLILLQTHHAAMRLFTEAREETLMLQFLERVLGEAEVEVLAGNLTGSGDFGKRYPDYSYSFEAALAGDDEASPLYLIVVNVESPSESRSMEMYVFNAEVAY